MAYPLVRMRRNRVQAWLRDVVAEHRLHVSDLIWPCFVIEGDKKREAVSTMPGVERISIDVLIEEVKKASALGIKAVALFPVVPLDKKCEKAMEALNPDNLICRAVAALKKAVPEVGVICDVALDPYTSHGQDGIVIDGDVENDTTVDVLCEQARVLVNAGADMVAPSDMMDGRVGAIRQMLEADGKHHIGVLSYAAKYASSFYGPFRDAVGSAQNLGKSNKAGYQMNPANSAEAIREVLLDVGEGADIVMVKPGLPYLDIIKEVKRCCNVPVFAYQVSGEYAMIQFAAKAGALDGKQVMLESLLAFKRAGASAILTYAAPDVAKWLNEANN